MKKILSCNLFHHIIYYSNTARVRPLRCEPSNGTKRHTIHLCIYVRQHPETKNGAASKNIQEMLDNNIPSSTTVVIQTGGAKKMACS